MSTEITEALRRGDTAAALAAARSAAQAQPENASVQHLLGVSLQRSGDLNGARAAFERAVALAPDHAGYPFALASLALSVGALDVAEENANRAVALDPNHLPAYVLAAQAALARRDREEAGRQLKLAQRVNDGHPLVRVLEGYIARFDGDEDLAMRCFAAAVKADPELPSAQVALGLGFLSRKLWPFAEQALANARRLAPNNVGVNRGLLEALRQQGKHPEMLALADELVAAQPGDLHMRLLRAELRAGAGQLVEGLEDALQVLGAQPTHPQPLAMALELLRLNGRGAEGRILAEAALEKAPGNEQLWALRAALAANLGDDPGEVLQRWMLAMPDSAAPWDQMASLHHDRGQTAAAIEAAKRALSITPGLPVSGVVLARAAFATDPAAALGHLEAVDLSATSTEASRSVLGWRALALDRLGRHDEAATHLRDLVRRPLARERALPQPLPAEGAPRAAAGTVLWSLAGVRVERLLNPLRASLGDRLRDPETMGADDSRAVTWLPFVDDQAVANLDGATWLAVVADPRDALLGWMMFGSTQAYRFPPDVAAAARWLAGNLQALLDLQARAPERVRWLRQDGDLAAGAAQASQVLDVPVKAEWLAALPVGPSAFPAGHWRHYRQAFAEEFALLAPVAEALGYPAD